MTSDSRADRLTKLSMYIDGEWVAPASGDYFETFNPFTARPWGLVPRGNALDADRAVQAAHRAFNGSEWTGMSPSARGKLMHRLAQIMEENAGRLAGIEVQDNGRLFLEMEHQVKYASNWFYYYAGLADKIEGVVHSSDKPAFNFSRPEPLGVCVGISPWNAPLLLMAFKCAPALAAGNTIVLKPSEYTSATALEMMKLFEQAGFPKGVVNVVTGYGKEVGEPLVAHPLVRHIAFTGSSKTGSELYSLAARGIKRVSLELGGKSPNIVFADADLKNAVRGVVGGIFGATGQTCIAGSRLLVEEKIHDEFVDALTNFARTIRIGDPMSPRTQIGPIASQMQYDKIMGYMDIANQEGAKRVLGGGRPDLPECRDGWFIEPTIFTGVENEMRIAQEEIFGPVLAVIPFRTDEEAIAIGNDVEFGLAAGVWTRDMRRALTMSERLQVGTVWVNTYRDISYTTPFGGYKKSGIGRESGVESIKEYLQTKSVWISKADEIANPFVIG